MKTPDVQGDHASPSEPMPVQPIALRIVFRRWRIFGLTILAMAMLSGFSIYFHYGQVVHRYTKDLSNPQKQEKKLLDKYNEYAGYVSQAFGTPTGIFVGAAAQVFLLRFFTTDVLQSERSYIVNGLGFGLTTGVAYMIDNGFGALNVQARDDAVHAVIKTSDLSFEYNSTERKFRPYLTSVNLSASEFKLGNSPMNTVLRNLILPRKPLPTPLCDWVYTQQDFKQYVPNDVVDYGMPSREWLEYMVPGLRTPDELRLIVNATDPNANKNVTAANLPMDAARAANLLVHGLFLSSQYIPWGKNKTWATDLPSYVTDNERNYSTARVMGLLPLDTTASEMDQRTWLLNATGPVMSRLFQGGTLNMSSTNIAVNFSHIDVIDVNVDGQFKFDAVTFELSDDPALYTSSIDPKNQTRYLQLDPYQCSPWPGRCLIQKRIMPPLTGLESKTLFDAPAQIHAFAMCLDDNGNEMVQSKLWRNGGTTMQDYNVIQCTNTSTSSILLVSVAKRMVADSLVQNVTVNGTDGPLVVPVASNVHKVYTFTVGRLGWKLQNFSDIFGAECDHPGGCMGISYRLWDEYSQVLVGEAGLPLDQVTQPYFGGLRQRPLPLVQVTEPARGGVGDQFEWATGDILMPHNIKNLWWDPQRTAFGTSCSAIQEDRVRRVLDNHLYMETTLQSTYTAGMYFMFQDALQKPIVYRGRQTDTLTFDGNVYEMVLFASTPLNNTLLTLAGILVLVICLLAALARSLYIRTTQEPDPLTSITEPHVIARAMLDESQFPSLLLRRRVLDSTDAAPNKLGGFEIQALHLQHQNSDQRVIATAV